MKKPQFHRIVDYDRGRLPNPLQSRPDANSLTQQDGVETTDLSPGDPGWGLLYHLLLTTLHPDRFNYIVETGTNWGVSTIVLAQALIDSRRAGEVATIERDPKNLDKARLHFAEAGVADRIRGFLGDSAKLLPEVAARHETIRVAYLDGNHEMDHVLREFATVHPRMEPDGLVILANTFSIADPGEDQRVFGAIDIIRKKYGGELINLPYASWYTAGIAIWQNKPFVDAPTSLHVAEPTSLQRAEVSPSKPGVATGVSVAASSTGAALVSGGTAPRERPASGVPQAVRASRIAEARAALRHAVEATPPPPAVTAVGKRTYPVPDLQGEAPSVTIVVPFYNEERFVADAIVSLKNQTVTNFEVVVVDDASTDRSAAVAIETIANDPRFKLVRHLRNAGLGASRNTGLRMATASYITFLDADDILLPDALEIRLTRFGELTDDRVGGVFCGVLQAAETIKADFMPARRNFHGRVHTFVSAGGECPFNAHAPILRTDILRRLGGFDETMRFGCEDWDLWQRVMRHGYWFEPVHKIGSIYRRKAGSMVRSMPLEHLRAGQRIFNWVHAPISPYEIVPGTPFVFSDGIDAYRREDNFLKRTVQYSAMAFMRGHLPFRQFLPGIPGDLWPYAMKHFDVPKVIESGLLRYVAVDDADAAALGEDMAAARDVVLAHCDAAALENCKPAKQRPAKPNLDVAFFAANAKQAALMGGLAGRLREAARNAVLVSVETTSGDQGVEDTWISMGLPYVSVNSYALHQSQMSAPLRVVMRPYDGTIRELATMGAETVLEIVDGNAPVDLPDDNLPAEANIVVAAAQSYAKLTELLAVRSPGGTAPVSRLAPAVVPERIGLQASYVLPKEAYVLPKEERLDLLPDYERLLAFKNRYKGERCFIIGNGPSLNTLDLTKLKNEFTFAVNGIFYKKDEMGFDPTFYVVEDSSVMKENIDAIRAYNAKHKFFPTIYRSLHPAGENVQFFLMNRGFYERESASFCVPRFSVDAARRVFCGQSVTHINLQMAYYFGFSKVYLIGMDFSYVIPSSAIVKGDLIISTEDDPNHFHPSYFGAGKSWKDPRLSRVKLNYEVARDMFAAAGREVINATNGGNLSVFPRASYDKIV